MFICELVREYIIILYWGECVLLAITGQCQAIGVAFLVSILTTCANSGVLARSIVL